MSDKNTRYSKLTELHRSGYEIVEGEPDIRGWKVRNLEGRTLGTVDELLFDADANKVRYLVLDLNGKPINLISRKILIPIGIAELHEINNDVVLPTITVQHLATLPEYKRSQLTTDIERKIRNIFSDNNVAATTEINDDDDIALYDHQNFEDDRFYKNRKQQHTPRRRIVNDEYNNANDRVKNDNDIQQPANTTNTTNTNKSNSVLKPFEEGTIELTEKAEVPVVTKEPRVVEEISLNKEVTHRDETVKDAVRKTEVDVERFDNDDDINRT